MIFKVTEDKLFLKLIQWDNEIQLKQIQISLTKKIKNYFSTVPEIKIFICLL